MKKIKLLLTIATGISTPLIIVSCKEKTILIILKIIKQ
ncbi:Vmc-like lipoprotein signal peptide domain-containing protein [Mycoplasmopsis felis]